MVRKWLNSYLGFTKKEQNGLLVLCLLMCLIALVPWVYPHFFPDENYNVNINDLNDVTARDGFDIPGDNKPLTPRLNPNSLKKAKLFPFNPNGLPAEKWRELGLSMKQIAVIHNYERKGGIFRKKEDLKRVYSISEKVYNKLAPYIRISENEIPSSESYFRPSSKSSGSQSLRVDYSKDYAGRSARSFPIIELNGADSSSLILINGIGPVLSSRIIRYRARLGGFYSLEQLREVYGIDSSRYPQIAAQVSVDTAAIARLYINKVSFDELRKFPYLSYKQVNAILQYRKQHGNYDSLDDLRHISILDTKILLKIAPYISFK